MYSIIVLYTVIIAATEVVVITVALGITAEMPTTKLRICAADREDPKPQVPSSYIGPENETRYPFLVYLDLFIACAVLIGG